MVSRFVMRAIVAAAGLAAVSAPTAAQELVYQDEFGIWRYATPPEGADPFAPPNGWRSVPPVEEPPPGWRIVRPLEDGPGLRLRRIVPSYDDQVTIYRYEEEPDEYRPGARAARVPRFDDVYGRSSARYRSDPLDGPVVRSAPDSPGWSTGDPQQPEIPLPDEPEQGGPLPGADIADGIARYAAAKRAALAESDPTRRLSSVRSANAYLVTLSRGAVSPEAIQAVDLLMGLEPVTKDTTQLPGAGTELKDPDAEPSRADRQAAERIADYWYVRADGDDAEKARTALPLEGEPLDPKKLAALDDFLGVDADLASTR